MATRLLEAGHEVLVHSRGRGPVDALAERGARPVGSPAEIAAGADVVLAALPTVATVEQVFLGPGGLVESARPGQVLADHSTVGPELSRRIAAAAAERGAAFLDAPVSGGPERAAAGTLTVMVGGDRAAFERALPLLEAFGAHVHHVGPSGLGTVIKLVNQLLVGIHTAASAEAAVFGATLGADPQAILDIIGTSFGGSTMLTRNLPRMMRRDFSPATPGTLVLKDLTIIADAAREANVRLLLGALAQQVFVEARGAGLIEADMAALVQPLERLAGVEVRRPVS
jgi:3-hydroxyisobutyrate dehydrogenase/2-hydroxy-3-oxopropionate reductase